MSDRLHYWQRGRLIFGAELGGREKLVLLAISDHLGSNASAWPSVPRLVKRCGLARATILRSLKLMENQGAITVTRIVGSSNRYQISIEWLTANQSQCDTSLTVTPVSERHPPSITVTPPPVSERHHTSLTVTPKGDQEGNQEKEIKKATKTARKTAGKSKRQLKEEAAKAEELRLRAQVKAVPKPDGLPDGYAELFDLWVDVRKNFEAWTKHESQTARFHKKMLKAHLNRKDIMSDLGTAHEQSWQGINVSRLSDLPIKVAVDHTKPRRHTKTRAELLADYQRTLEIS